MAEPKRHRSLMISDLEKWLDIELVKLFMQRRMNADGLVKGHVRLARLDTLPISSQNAFDPNWSLAVSASHSGKSLCQRSVEKEQVRVPRKTLHLESLSQCVGAKVILA